MEINKKQYEDIINDTFPGLTMYVRDVDLEDKYASKYQPGMIIREKGFTDASCRVMGMMTTHRYAILSNHMADFTQYEHDTNWGLFVAQRDSHFKVLDIYKYEGKTQILLLHLPNDKRWKMFENLSLNIEEQFIETSRQRFRSKCMKDVIPELATERWLDRCRFPIGMDDEGNLFDNDINPEDELRQAEILDSFRYPSYPDDIAVTLMEEGMKPENVWVRCCKVGKREIFGVLLNEPSQDFGVHCNDVIGFVPVEQEDRVRCICTFHVLERN